MPSTPTAPTAPSGAPIDSATASGRLPFTPYPCRGRYEGEPAIITLIEAAALGGVDDEVILDSGRSVAFIKSFEGHLGVSRSELFELSADLEVAPSDLDAELDWLKGLPVAIETTDLGFVFLHYGAAATRAIQSAHELEAQAQDEEGGL